VQETCFLIIYTCFNFTEYLAFVLPQHMAEEADVN